MKFDAESENYALCTEHMYNPGGTMELIDNIHGLISTWACRRHNGPCRKHAGTDEYSTEACRRDNGSWQKYVRTDEYSSLQKKKTVEPVKKYAGTKEYSANTRSTLSKTPSLQNPHTLTHVSPSCDLTCDWSKLNAWPTPWQHRLSTRGSLVACDLSELAWPALLGIADHLLISDCISAS